MKHQKKQQRLLGILLEPLKMQSQKRENRFIFTTQQPWRLAKMNLLEYGAIAL